MRHEVYVTITTRDRITIHNILDMPGHAFMTVRADAQAIVEVVNRLGLQSAPLRARLHFVAMIVGFTGPMAATTPAVPVEHARAIRRDDRDLVRMRGTAGLVPRAPNANGRTLFVAQETRTATALTSTGPKDQYSHPPEDQPPRSAHPDSSLRPRPSPARG